MTESPAHGQTAMPALFHAADQSSQTSQRRFLRLTTAQLLLLAAAAATTIATWRSGDINYAALVGAAAIVFAGVMRVQIQITNPMKTWYQGRAAAESVKTLAWRYAVGGEPFSVTLSEADVDQRFVERLHEVIVDLDGLDIVEVEDLEEITPWMRETRRRQLDERKQTYEGERIRDQRAWYSNKSKWNSRRANLWGTAMLGFEAFAVLQALLKATSVVDVNLLAFTATVIAGIAAWIQTKDFHTLASAYAVASRELSTINSLIRHQDTEDDWARFIADSEDAISREHTLWRASRK